VRKGNAALREKLDKGLAAIRADGTYDRIYASTSAPRRPQAVRRRPRPPPRSSERRAVGFADLRWSILSGYGPLFLQGLWMTLGLTAVALTGGLALGIVLGLISSTTDSPRPRTPRRGLRLAAAARRDPRLRRLLPRHAALRADPARALRADADAGAARGRPPAQRRGGARLPPGARRVLLGCARADAQRRAYISEILRAGIHSIHGGQTQAAYSVGLTHGQAMRYIVLPQALRRMVPALVNEAVSLVKDSSLVSAIGLAELALAARTVAAPTRATGSRTC
jgi:polar amino acid transport system permease protein